MRRASVRNRPIGGHYTYRNENGVALGAFILEPLAQAADGDACSLAHAGVHILESCVDDRPDAIRGRNHKLRAALDGDAEREHTTAAEVGLENPAGRTENQSRRQVRGKSIDNTESRLVEVSVEAERTMFRLRTRGGASSSTSGLRGKALSIDIDTAAK